MSELDFCESQFDFEHDGVTHRLECNHGGGADHAGYHRGYLFGGEVEWDDDEALTPVVPVSGEATR